MKQIYTYLSLLLSLNSCISTQNGSIESSSFSVKNNFKIISTVEGESNATYILGIGGNLKDSLMNEAKKNMYLKYSLQSNQNLTNITTDIKKTYFILPLLYTSQKIIVSADVIQFFDNIELPYSNEKGNIDSKMTTTIPNSNNDISNPKSKEEVIIDSVINRKNKILIAYKSIEDVNIGDIVQYPGYSNENIYGIVFEIGIHNKVKIKTFPFPGQELIIENKYSWFSKIVF